MADPVRFVCSGIGKVEIQRAVQDAGGQLVEVSVTNDMEGAQAVKAGRADYFIGSCLTGQGGALAAAIAVLGYPNCTLLSASGKSASQEVGAKVGAKDWKAFGVKVGQVSTVVPALVDALLDKHQLR